MAKQILERELERLRPEFISFQLYYWILFSVIPTLSLIGFRGGGAGRQLTCSTGKKGDGHVTLKVSKIVLRKDGWENNGNIFQDISIGFTFKSLRARIAEMLYSNVIICLSRACGCGKAQPCVDHLVVQPSREVLKF